MAARILDLQISMAVHRPGRSGFLEISSGREEGKAAAESDVEEDRRVKFQNYKPVLYLLF
uniref:Uncharacterized protein n=1 Tax=Leersia perrieri TaxID=77586 RepID=A0A0D9V2R1_9ORYZ